MQLYRAQHPAHILLLHRCREPLKVLQARKLHLPGSVDSSATKAATALELTTNEVELAELLRKLSHVIAGCVLSVTSLMGTGNRSQVLVYVTGPLLGLSDLVESCPLALVGAFATACSHHTLKVRALCHSVTWVSQHVISLKAACMLTPGNCSNC